MIPNANASNNTKTDYDSRWVLALYSEYRTLAQGVRAGSKGINRTVKIGVAFFDNTTLQFHIGTIEDDF